MDVVYSSSDAYSCCTGVSLFSLYLNNKDIKELNVHILSTDISDNNKQKLKEVANEFHRELDIIDAKQDFIDEANRLHLQLLRGAYNTYSRVVLNRWFSHLDKIMVIDSDTMVCGSIKEAWDLNIEQYMLAAVPELAIYSESSHLEDPGLVNSIPLYYNMGICVVNLKKWREDDIESLIVSSIESERPVFKIADQSIINKYVGNQITRLPLKFNYYSTVHNISYKTINSVFDKKILFTEKEYIESANAPAIIHYFGHSFERPWFKNSIALRKEEYLRIREATPWRNTPLSKWRKGEGAIFRIYDIVCYLLCLWGFYTISLKFRYIWGQRIKEFLHKERP